MVRFICRWGVVAVCSVWVAGAYWLNESNARDVDARNQKAQFMQSCQDEGDTLHHCRMVYAGKALWGDQ